MSRFFRAMSFVFSAFTGAFIVNAMWAFAACAVAGAISALVAADALREDR